MRRIHFHGVHQRLGGAARIAQSLHDGLKQRGFDVARTFEIQDEPGEAPGFCQAGQLATQLQEDDILHLHGSLNLPQLLNNIPLERQPIVITLHDCRFFTGGCVYPLQCEGWRSGCPGPCPRDFSECAREAARHREILRKHLPVLAAPSSWIAGMAREMFPELSIRHVPNGVKPQPAMNKKLARKELGLPADAKLALFAAHGGEAAAYKSGSRWLELWKKIKALEPQALGMFIGGVETSREGDLFRWPYLPPEKLSLFLAAADVLVYPTLADNHSLIVLEAMATGTVVVAFRVGGIPEQIRHQESGVLLDPDDWLGMAQTATGLLARPRLAAGMGQKGRELQLRHFTQDRMLDKYAKLYETF